MSSAMGNGSRLLVGCTWLLMMPVLLISGWVMGQDDPPVADNGPKQRGAGHLIRVDLPITGRTSSTVRQSLKQILEGSGNVVRAADRPVVVLQFDVEQGQTGQGSSLGACIDLARFLTSPEMSRLETVAYVPDLRKTLSPDAAQLGHSRLLGHAVLVALAADEIYMHPAASMGSAGRDESSVDEFVREAYRNVVAKRLTLPVPVALAMLDADRTLYRVSTADGTVYADDDQLRRLEATGAALDTVTLSRSGQLAEFSGQQLVDFGLIRKTADNRNELARHLNISSEALQIDRAGEAAFQALRVELPDYVDQATLQWISRALESRLASGKINMVIFSFNSTSGDVDACLQMARRLSTMPLDQIRTVAYIAKRVSGPPALIALSCRDVIMQQDATIGGNFQPEIAEDDREDLKLALSGIAESLERDPAVMQAVIDPALPVVRFRDKTTGLQRLMTQLQRNALVDSENWLPQGPLDFFEPLTAETAENNGISRQTVSSFEELSTFYQLQDPPQSLQPTAVDRWLQRVGTFLASPFVAPWLLFAAMFFLFNEISQPGLGVPGFLGTVCLILYFWSQHLDGNAHWLEILLFAAGAMFLGFELFVLPGFGVFGIGGLLMIVASIVLASQTFVFPTTTEELQQLPKSLFALVGAFGGMVFAMVVLRSVLPKTPIFKKLMLEPPTMDPLDPNNTTDPESMVNWGYLMGKRGEAVTNLVPSGKARIGGQLIDVISDGRLIEKGQPIEVVQVSGNRVVVQSSET